MKLYFVRHGETDWNVRKKIQGSTDIPLNETGRKQARQLAQTLRRAKQDGTLDVAGVYTSPQLRAKATAQAAADALGVSCTDIDGLREMEMGEWEGLRWGYIRKSYGEIYLEWERNHRYTKTPGGESYDELLGRTLAALEEIMENATGDMLIVTHSAVIMVLRCYLAGRPFDEMVSRFKVDNAEVVELDGDELRRAAKQYRDEAKRREQNPC